jgi:polar amino acid transport system substrate-binding protein
LAIVLRRNDDDLQVIVDRAVSRLFRSSDMSKLYTAWFGRPGGLATIFYQLSALPE